MSRITRVLILATTVLVLAGCGSGDEPATPTGNATTDSAFPVTIEHEFGTTTVPSTPKRIAVVGLNEQDTVLALGFKPIATTEWYGDQPYAVWPWAQAALGTSKPTVLANSDGFQFEKIAALRPDLIIGTNSGMKSSDYKKLSAIAPTIAAGKGATSFFWTWDKQTEQVAKALGKEAEGKALVARIKADFAKVGDEHPAFKGKTVTFAQNAFYDGELYAYPEGLNTEFLSYLGLTINPKLAKIDHKSGEQVAISPERLDVLDADAIVFATEKPGDVKELEKVGPFKSLPAVAKHRAVFTDATLSGAMYFITPLSLPYVLDRLPPLLDAALAGRSPRRMVETP